MKPCKIWIGKLHKGYPYSPRSKPPHVLACEEQNGPRPVGLEASHLCHVRACHEPSHLIWESRADNIRRTPNAARVAANKKRAATMGPEALSACAKKICATIGRERLPAIATKRFADMGADARRSKSIKGWVTRRLGALK